MSRWDKLSYEEQQRRLRVWRHNSYFGHCRMMQVQLEAMIASSTTSPMTKAFARSTLASVQTLAQSLQKRIDP